MAAGGAEALAGGAVVVFLGVAASLVFERFRIPDVAILLVAGIVLGPLLHVADASTFAGAAGIFTSLALAVILFEGGLDLNVMHLRARVGLTTVLLMTSYFATAGVVGVVARYAVGIEWPLAILFGFVIAPLSSSILIPLLGRLRVLPETKALLTVESALGDVLAVLTVFTLANVLGGGGVDVGGVARSLASSFLLGSLLAFGAGVAWLFLLRFLQGRPYAYLVTFAASLLLFGAVDAAGGNGVVAILVFALVLGNADQISKRLPGEWGFRLDDRIRWFHAEMSFFVRTFFFLYLGLLVTPGAFGLRMLATTVLVVAAILVARGVLVYALVQRRPQERQDAAYLTFLAGRGLASAALATVPPVAALTAGTPFQDLAFAVILLSNVAMTVFILAKEGGPGAGAEPEAALVDLTTIDLHGLNALEVEAPRKR